MFLLITFFSGLRRRVSKIGKRPFMQQIFVSDDKDDDESAVSSESVVTTTTTETVQHLFHVNFYGTLLRPFVIFRPIP